MTVGHGLVLKGQKIFVPKPLREEMLERLHEGHLGINKTLMKARDVLFWPGMAAEITEKVKKCPVCLENRPCQQSEPLKSHEIPHLDINKTLMKARDVLFWPGMAAEITEKVKKCPVCLEN